MAGSAVSKTAEHHPDSMLEALRDTVNKLVDDLEALRNAHALHQHSALNAAPSNNVVAAATLTGYKVNKRQ